MDDHRRATRHRVLKGAQIVFNNGTSVIDCLIRDLCETGAKIKVVSPVGIPETFTLKVTDGPSYEAKIVWRRPNEIGVTFHNGAAAKV